MLSYTWRTLRARLTGFVGTFLALACAAAMLCACGILLETGLRGTIDTERYAGVAIVVSADQDVHQRSVEHDGDKTKDKDKDKAKPLAGRVWLPPGTAARVARVPGVRAAIPEVTFPAYVADRHGRLVPGAPSYGHGWSSAALTPFRLVSGRAPAGTRQVVVDRGLAARAALRPGVTVVVQATGAPTRYRVSGVAAAPHGDLAHQRSLFFADAEATRLSGRHGAVDAVGVTTAAGVASASLARRVDAALPRSVKVRTGGGRGPVEFLDAADARTTLVSMAGAMGGTALLVAVLVVTGTLALSVRQRLRELALLRAIGAPARQVRRLVGREAFVVGLVAGAAGVAAGVPLAGLLRRRFVQLHTIPATLHETFGVLPPLVAIAATALGAWAAAGTSVRRAGRIEPTAALTEAAVEPRRAGTARLVVGVVVLAGAGSLLGVLRILHTEAGAQPVSYVTVVLLCTALALLGPLVVRAVLTVLGAPLHRAGSAPHLAVTHARANATRLAAVITPLALLVAMACTVLFLPLTLTRAADEQTRAGDRADWVVTSAGPGVPTAAAAAVRRLPGVAAVTEVVRTEVRVGLDDYPAQGVTPRGLAATWDPGVRSGSLAGFGDHDVALSRVAADDLGKRPGDTVSVTLGDGTRTSLLVAAVYDRGLGFGDLTLSQPLVARHVDDPLAAAVLVKTSAVPSPALRSRVAAVLARFPGVTLRGRDASGRMRGDVEGNNDDVSFVAMAIVIAFTAIAVVNTLAMSLAERGRELSLLHLVGVTRRQQLRTLWIETVLVLAFAVVLGSGAAALVLSAYGAGMTGSGRVVFDLARYAGVVALAGVLALTSTAVAGRWVVRGQRRDPVPALYGS